MALTRPNTITSLADAYTNRKLGKASVDTLMNLMGVVIDVLSPTRTLTRGISSFLPLPRVPSR
jgi:hypothetical protein